MTNTNTKIINSSFSKILPTLQLAFDSTSMGNLETCPQLYEYINVLGYTPPGTNAHLKWGLEYHASLEAFDRSVAKGLSYNDSLFAAVKTALVNTWDFKLSRPWVSDHPLKNRLTLIRSVIWYLDQFRDDPIQTVIFPDGTPAVEKSFRFDPGIVSLSTGENFIICGHLDRIGKLHQRFFILDRKTTKGAIGTSYFKKYTPDTQMQTYDLAGTMVFFEEMAGIIIDVAQVGVNFTRFARGQVNYDTSLREEHLQHLQDYLRLAETYAKNNHWPMNKKACNAYSSYNQDFDTWNHEGCPFRDVCSSPKNMRQQLLETFFEKKIWDPLQVREV